MSRQLKPIYTPENCHPAYQLNWSLTLFWREDALPSALWIDALKEATEPDGVRILEHHANKIRTTQFLLSATPCISPKDIIRSVKARLQYLIRDKIPKAFYRNYSMNSVGSAKREVLDGYLDSQLERHQMADRIVQERLHNYQIDGSKTDLSKMRRTSHGEFDYNLHIVLVNEQRWREIHDERLASVRNTIVKASRKKEHLVLKARILADHIHLMIGCGISETPLEVALGYLNNLVYAQEMRPIYQFGFFVGTFGNYDLGAIRQKLR